MIFFLKILIICSFEFFVEVCEGLMNYISAHPDEFKIKDRMTVGHGRVMYFSNFLNEKNAKAGAQVAYHPYPVEMENYRFLIQ